MDYLTTSTGNSADASTMLSSSRMSTHKSALDILRITQKKSTSMSTSVQSEVEQYLQEPSVGVDSLEYWMVYLKCLIFSYS
jgi:hypothetical protein